MKHTFLRKLTAAFLAAVMVVIMLPAMAFPIAAATEGTCGTGVTWALNTKTRTLTISGSGAMNDYTSSTKAPWYDSRTLINKLVIEKGITYVGDYAFYYLSNLSSVMIPDSVTEIGDSAFKDCNALQNLEIPSSVKAIGTYAFYNCDGIVNLTLPSVEYISSYAFGDCDGIANIIIPNVVTIGDHAFYSCNGIVNLTIPGNVKIVDNYAFSDCYCLKTVEFLEGVEILGYCAFEDCGLESVTMADSIESMGSYVFAYCVNLVSVKLSNSLCEISNGAFYECSSLESIVIPDGVTIIDEWAFYYCYNLSNITIPNTVGTIEEAFNDYNLINVIYCGTYFQWSTISDNNEGYYTCGCTNTCGCYCYYDYNEDGYCDCSYCNEYCYGGCNCSPIYLIWYENITYHSMCTLDEGVMRIEPSCKSEGVKVYTCKVCGIEKLEWLDKLEDHGWGEGTVTVAPTHTTEGIKTYTCGCGETMTETLAKLEEHEWDEGTVTVEPTHTTEGVKTFNCECGATKTESVAKLDGHTWDEGTVTIAPTHTTEGVKTYTCECGETKTEAIAVIPHSFGNWENFDGSQHSRDCECGETEYAGHEWDEGRVTVAPTFTTSGEKTFTCSECSATKTETIPVLEVGEDTPKVIITTAPVLKGETVQITVRIKNNPGLAALAFGVSIDEDVFEFVSADLTESVFRQFGICGLDRGTYKFNGLSNGIENITEDGVVVVITLKAKETAQAGTYELIANLDKANTIDVSGNPVALISVKSEITVTEHECTFGDWELYDTEKHVRACYCGAKEYADHAWDDGVITTQPTHFTEGVITYTCVCNATKVGTAEKLPDHVWDEGTVNKAPTHIEEGIMLHSCECGATKFENIAKLPDHEWDEGTVTVEPTHLEEGVKTFNCICGETKTEALEKLEGHTFGNWNKLDTDSHARYCECGEKEVADHNWDDGKVSTAPTYVAEGVKTFDCEDCDATKTEAIPTLEVTATTPKFTVVGNTSMAGGTVKITVTLENNPGVWGTAFRLPIDTEVFEFVSADTNGSIFSQFGVCGYDEAAKAYKFNGYNRDLMNNITEDGTVVVITLKVKDGVEAGEYKLSAKLSERDIINADGAMVSFASVEGTVEVIDYILGDVNGDTYITNADVLMIFRYIYNPELYPVNVIAADVNHDSYVTNADVLAIFRYIYNSELYPIA